MHQYFIRKGFTLIIYPLAIIAILLPTYYHYSQSFPVAYWDEFLWVGRSYFIDFYSHRDFHNPIWQTQESYDQPKLTEFVYGIWISNLYKNEISENNKYGYTSFLLQSGFSAMDKKFIDTYRPPSAQKNVQIDTWFSGDTDDYVKTYGPQFAKAVEIIYQARKLNILILVMAVIFLYFFSLHYLSPPFAVILSLMYGFNNLVVNVGLMAHADALFHFSFNGALLFLVLYLFKKNNFLLLLGFAIFTGLCASTKINGFMLLIVFAFSLVISADITRKNFKKYASHMLIAGFISLCIFILLNPFTYSSPINKIVSMAQWRIATATEGQRDLYPESFLSSKSERISKIVENFYFGEKMKDYNRLVFVEKNSNFSLWYIHLIYFSLIGYIRLAYGTYKRNRYEAVLLSAFLIIIVIMSYYLLLDWGRYYVHLILFFLIFQFIGISSIFDGIIFYYRQNIMNKSLNYVKSRPTRE